MRHINCYIPIKVRITGVLSDEQLDHLSKTVASSVATRLALAERTIQAAFGGHWLPGGAEVREPYDPAREDPSGEGYYVPSYQGRGASQSLHLQQKGHESHGWTIRKRLTFRVQVRRLLDYFAKTRPAAAAALRSEYFEFLDQTRTAAVWVVVAQRPIFADQIAEEVQEQYELLLPHNLDYFFGYTIFEDSRQQLLLLAAGNELRQLPDLSNNPGKIVDGQAILYRGGVMLFIGMALPRVTLGRINTSTATKNSPKPRWLKSSNTPNSITSAMMTLKKSPLNAARVCWVWKCVWKNRWNGSTSPMTWWKSWRTNLGQPQ